MTDRARREDLVAEIATLRAQLATAEERLAALRIGDDEEAAARAADVRMLRWLAFGVAVILVGGALLASCA